MPDWLHPRESAPPEPSVTADHGSIAAGGDINIGLDEEGVGRVFEQKFEKIEALLKKAARGGAFQRAQREGFSEVAVRKIVARLGGEGIAEIDLLPWLDNWIEAAQREIGRHTNEDEAFEAARQEAERRFKAGHESPSSALMDEFAREERIEGDRQEERKRRRLRLLEEAVRIDEIVLDADGATKKLRRMAEIEGRSGWQQIGLYLFERANEFCERGDQKGENSALIISIAAYRSALAELTRERVPLDWAMIQSNLGTALEALGERESGTARLEEAVAAFREALTEITRARVPLDWATIQSNLGTALEALGERESGTARLEDAVAAYRDALKESTRGRTPLDWAVIQNNLGTALKLLGERESGTERLEDAVAAYRDALKECTRVRAPLDWAMIQNNLGNALKMLGERESGIERLEDAAAAYRDALREWTRERVPLNWATAQNNLGNALLTLGERESGTARLEDAVDAHRDALKERTRERVPLDWARSIGSQGVALRLLAERRGALVMAQRAHAQITEAFETFRVAPHAPYATYYEAQLVIARALVERLRKG
jgi:tetratricopeptide (TPR) repeat protein